MKDTFRPIANTAPIGFAGKLVCGIRYLVDFQYHTVVDDIREQLKKTEGVLLDVGCGDSPYRPLLNTNCEYIGIDIEDRQNLFGYNRGEILYFDHRGGIPLDDGSIDCILCTEVLEHVFNYAFLIEEMYRVCKPKGKIIITVPWSARYHYIPNDYFRYTPATLGRIFERFKRVEVKARGTDVTSICAKVIVICARQASLSCNSNILHLILLPLKVLFVTPLASMAIFWGHLSLIFSIGSQEDPLGYTILLEK